jgi:hypothetical protein
VGDQLQGARLKVERAKQHIHELRTILGEFFESEPYVVGVDKEAQPGKNVYKVVRVSCPPLSVAVVAGDAVHSLRSALDHLFCALVVQNGKTINRADQFPIADSAKLFKTGGIPKIRGRVSDDALKLIERVKPYGGGNEALWRLHRLDIADKHRALYVVGSAYRGVARFMPRITLASGEKIDPAEAFPNLYLRPADRLFPLKEGDELFIVPPEYDNNPKFSFQLAFSEPGVVEGEPVVEALDELVGATEHVIELFDALV